MIPTALNKSKERLRKARQAIDALPTCTSAEAFNDTWFDFLVASNGIYIQLRLATKENAKSRQWFGGKTQERKSDPLLQYLHQARNADEHGIEQTIRINPGSLRIGAATPGALGEVTISGNLSKEFTITNTSNMPITITTTAPTCHLVSVFDDRSGKTYDPPTAHLGTPIADQSPVGVATLALTYLSNLLDEADAFS
tara:strand:+ start:1024 stop:1614 length:591 start_codon:yes stop_codon:yes gene_type:complete